MNLTGCKLFSVRPILMSHTQAGQTPLHVAAEHRQPIILDMLLRAASLEVLDATMARRARRRRLQMLASKDKHGWTPLHFAAYVGCPICVRLLLSYGSPALPDKTGKSPLYWVRGSSDEIQSLLLARELHVQKHYRRQSGLLQPPDRNMPAILDDGEPGPEDMVARSSRAD